MNQKKGRKRRTLQIIISAIIGVTIVWFLLSKIELKDIPMAIGNIPKQDLLIAFFLYVISVFFKAFRFRAILRSDIGLRRIFSIV